jgi:4'-phosphopantetheinyl transferase
LSRERSTTSILSWPSTRPEPRLASNDIHLWCVPLNDFHGQLERFHAILSPDERLRATRFHVSTDRDHFVVCRGVLRALLGQYLRRDPSAVEFAYGQFGKPHVAGPCVDGPVYFNASHSGALALIAVTSVCPVGVDVERLRMIPDFEQLASRFFAPTETSRLMALPPAERIGEFFTCWTGKEAFLKATGEGIGGGLASHAPPDWQLQRLSPATGYIGAIAYRNESAHLSQWSISTLM